MTNLSKLDALAALAEQATPGPWAFAQTGDKCWGAAVWASVFADDADAPLSGDLTEFEGGFDVLDSVCELGDRRLSASDAALIAASRTAIPALIQSLRECVEALAPVTDLMCECLIDGDEDCATSGAQEDDPDAWCMSCTARRVLTRIEQEWT